MTEQERLYGQLICDFVNAKTTDEALTSLYGNLQKAFGFSLDFPEHAKYIFPTLESYQSQLSVWVPELMSLVLKEKKVESTLKSLLQTPFISLCGYELASHSLLFEEIEYRDDEEFEDSQPVPVGEPFQVTIDEIKKDFPKFCWRGAIPEGFDDHEEPEVAIQHINNLMAVGEQLSEYQNDITGEYRKQVNGYNEILEAHTLIRGFQRTTRKVLEDVRNKRPFSEGIFFLIMHEYNEKVNIKQIYLSKEGVLKKSIEAYENWLLLYYEGEPLSHQFSKLRNPICIALVEILLNPANLNYLKKCDQCNGFFIASRPTKKYCSKKCKDRFNNDHRNPEDKKKAVQNTRNNRKGAVQADRDAKRIRHMVNQGLAEQEARDFIMEEDTE